MADYHSSGIWIMKPMLGFRHGMFSYEALGLPNDLKSKFKKWIEIYNARIDNQDFDTKEFDRKGLELAKELKSFVGPQVYVEYEPQESDFGIRMTELMNREITRVPILYRIYLRLADFISWQMMRFTGNIYTSLYHRAMDEALSNPKFKKELNLLREETRNTVVIK